MVTQNVDGRIVVEFPWGEVRMGKYRWLNYGEDGADGMTLRIIEWDKNGTPPVV